MDAIQPVVDSLCESMRSGNLVDETLIQNSGNGISLLALKNDALLSYVNNLLLVAAAQLEQNEDLFKAARQRSIEQRVTLEKGIKGLEAKISYQVDKALRAYRKSVEQAEQAEAQRSADGVEQDSDSDVDPTAFRPNVSHLQTQQARAAHDGGDESSDDDHKKYVAPKISATAPAFEKAKKQAAPRRRRDFAMEEYIRETGDAPVAEPSIGSQIMDGGRGGQRTARERRKDSEIQDYEESNFTRISETSTKKARKEAFKRQQDASTRSFFGEDWNFLDHDDDRGSRRQAKKRRKQ